MRYVINESGNAYITISDLNKCVVSDMVEYSDVILHERLDSNV